MAPINSSDHEKSFSVVRTGEEHAMMQQSRKLLITVVIRYSQDLIDCAFADPTRGSCGALCMHRVYTPPYVVVVYTRGGVESS